MPLPLTMNESPDETLDGAVIADVASPSTMQDLVSRRADILDVIVLDEFSYDVVVRINPALYAVYGST